MPANNDAMNNVGNAGIFIIIIIAVNTGTSRSHGEMLKVFANAEEKTST